MYQLYLDALISTIDNTPCVDTFFDALSLLSEFKEEQPEVERAYNRYIRSLAAPRVALAALTSTDDAYKLSTCIEQMLRLDARDDFDSYMLFMEWNREPEKRFYQPRREVLYPIVQDLQDLFDDKIDFLAYSTPPRVGKSTLGCFFVTFVMGNHPDRANVMSGHSDKLTSSFHHEVLSIICDGETYRFAELFPESPFMKKDMANETIHLASIRRFPTLTCRSIDGTLTGAVEVGRDALLYCDDLVEDREEALNTSRMDNLYAAYLNQLKDRMLDGAKQVFIGTRWVPNDPIGRIMEQYSGNPRYRFTSLPALDGKPFVDEDGKMHKLGKSNFVYQYDLGFSTEYYEDMYESLSEAGEEDSFYAKYLCAPYWKEGVLYTVDELNFFEELPEGEPDAVVAVCDSKTTGADYCVVVIGYVYGTQHFIQDVICSDALMENIIPRIVDKFVQHRVSLCRFESNVSGLSVARDVANGCKLKGLAIDVRTKYSTENKEARIEVDAGWVKRRCLFRRTRDKEYELFMHFLTTYTVRVSHKRLHDDVPDAMSMYKRLVDATTMAKVQPVRRII